MIKKLIILPALFGAFLAQGQATTTSPYSYFGIGVETSQNVNEINSVGGMGVYADSLHMNMRNPATYSQLQRATFSMGASLRYNETKDESSSFKGKSGGVDYLAFALPIKKFAIGVGISSYASTGYQLENNNTVDNVIITNKFNGEGGAYRTFLGASYRITESLSIGAEASYLFGDEIHGNTKLVADDGNGFASITGTQFAKKHTLKGLKYNVGVHYLKTLESAQQIYASASFSPQFQLENTYDYKIQTVKNVSGRYIPIQVKDVKSGKETWEMPYNYEVGLGYGKKNTWFVGAAYSFSNKSVMNKSFSYKNASFEDQSKWSLGGYVTPRYNSFTSYFSRMTYRLGVNYEKTGLIVDNHSISDRSLHLGLGFPVGHYASSVNVGFAFGQKGTSAVLLENYMQFSVGFSLNDVWFRKRKFE